MGELTQDNLATIEFQLSWEHDGIQHTDSQWVQRVNLWRDLLPSAIAEWLPGKEIGDRITIDLPVSDLGLIREEGNVRTVPMGQVRLRLADGNAGFPRYGRFYPSGILQGVPGVFRGNILPFRVIDADRRSIRADFNHPMSGRQVTLSAILHDVREKFEERGGTANAWVETLLDGPGFNSRANGRPTDFFSDHPFARNDEREDGDFYTRPRLVNHLDDTAIMYVSRLYQRLIPPGSRVLDLMSSWVSHLPADLHLDRLVGLGMNEEELEQNPRLDEHVVHDLNRDPRLPFEDGIFDAVICTVSVEYLTRPDDVFQEVARVLKPGGTFIVTFSNRWFPTKAVRIWTELHEFERSGLVLEYFRNADRFTDLESYSMRGLPRPVGDRYYSQQPFSDPVFGVWGRRSPAP